MHAYHLAT